MQSAKKVIVKTISLLKSLFILTLCAVTWLNCGKQPTLLSDDHFPPYKEMTLGVIYGNFKTIGIRVALESHTEVEPIFYFECQRAWQDSRPGGHTVAVRIANNKGETLTIGGPGPDSWHQNKWINDDDFHAGVDYTAAKAQLLNSGIRQKAADCLKELYIDRIFSANITDHVLPDSPDLTYVGPIPPGVTDNRTNKLSAHLNPIDESPLLWQWLEDNMMNNYSKPIYGSSSGSWGSWNALFHRPEIRPDGIRRGRHEEPGYEFREVLSLYYVPAFNTPFDHTGTITMILYRPKGNAQWKLFDNLETCNHGDCPSTKGTEMEFYELCDPKVAIDGWWAIDTECPGSWGVMPGKHLCNDDTAAQINNAFGIWTEYYCKRRGRMYRPNCRQHW